jgi:hypothetical protein
MGLLTQILRPSGLAHGRSPYYSLLSPGDIVPNFVSNPRVLDKRASALKIQTTLPLEKLSSALSCSE